MKNVAKIAQRSTCARVYKKGRYSRAGYFRIDVTDAVIGLRSVPQKTNRIGQNRPLVPSLASTVKHTPPPRTALHPRRHARLAEGFRLAFTAPTRCSRDSSGGAMKNILLCAAVACSASTPYHKKRSIYFQL